jgi:multiple sugar transport system permease protein
MKKGKLRIGGRALLLICMSILGLIFLFPFFWMFVTALKRPEELSVAIAFLPPVPQWQHFQQVLFTRDVIAFYEGLQNTLIICSIVTITVCLSSAMVGFGFARFRAPGRNILFTIVLSTMMLPHIVTLIPHYVIFSKLGLLALPWPFCYTPWLVTSIPGWAIFIFYYRQFFAGLPKELEDAALIDGCGRFRTFWQIFMPLAGPAVTTTCIFLFQWTYTDYVGPLLYLTVDNQTLAVLMMNHTNTPGVKYTQPIPPVPYQMTVGILFTLPLIALFFFAQRYFMQGLATTGLKG